MGECYSQLQFIFQDRKVVCPGRLDHVVSRGRPLKRYLCFCGLNLCRHIENRFINALNTLGQAAAICGIDIAGASMVFRDI